MTGPLNQILAIQGILFLNTDQLLHEILYLDLYILDFIELKISDTKVKGLLVCNIYHFIHNKVRSKLKRGVRCYIIPWWQYTQQP